MTKAFFKRLRAYIIGICIGIILVIFLFRDKSNLFTAWLPENRILIEISESRIKTTTRTDCLLKCIGVARDEFKENLAKKTKVDFSRSKARQEPRSYCLMQDVQGMETCLYVEIADSTAVITDVRSEKTMNCNCP